MVTYDKEKRAVVKTTDLITELKNICNSFKIEYSADIEEFIMNEAKKAEEERNTLLWLGYQNDICCLEESQVFLKGSMSYYLWLYPIKEHNTAEKIAYAIRLDGLEDGKVSATLYELDYEEHSKRVEERAVPTDDVHNLSGHETENFICGPCVPGDPLKHYLAIMTEWLCRDAKSVKIDMKLRNALENQWKKDAQKHLRGEEIHCLRCGNILSAKITHNARSRYADLYICSDCGVDEALRDMEHNVLNFKDWDALKMSRDMETPNNKLFLTHECKFMQVFHEKDPSTNRPVSEAAYLRADHDGCRWWTNWFFSGPKLNEELSEEIDGFMEALWNIPEMGSPITMKRLCCAAEISNNPAEFNLYSETLNFYVWIQMTTRRNDYYLYVRFYRKDLTGGLEKNV